MDQNYDNWDRDDDGLWQRMGEATKIGALTPAAPAWIGIGIILGAKILGQAIRDSAEAITNGLRDVAATNADLVAQLTRKG